MSRITLVLRYASFAGIATLANLVSQRLVLLGSNDLKRFVVAVAVGTIVGLVVKYLLDSRWIFFDRQGGMLNHGKKFTLYTAMGVFTTAIFCGTETAFWLVWGSQFMREVGAVLGLTIGYVIKYQLDRRFVFALASTPGQTA